MESVIPKWDIHSVQCLYFIICKIYKVLKATAKCLNFFCIKYKYKSAIYKIVLYKTENILQNEV